MINFAQELVSGVAKIFPDAIFYKETTNKEIALTIDDAPCLDDPDDMGLNLILDTIATHNQKYSHLLPVKATFFIISGHLKSGSNIITEILAHGHEVANHGVVDETHALLTPEKFEKQLKEAHEKLLELTNGKEIRWYRPGRGLYNQQMIRAIAKLTAQDNYDLQLVLASMIPFDTFDFANHPWLTATYAKQMIFPGAILVFHANSLKVARNTAIALKTILEDLRRRDYQIVSISQLWSL